MASSPASAKARLRETAPAGASRSSRTVTRKGSGDLNGSVFTELGTRLQSTSGGYVRGSLSRFNYNVSANGMLTPGETVVLDPPDTLADGARVRMADTADR